MVNGTIIPSKALILQLDSDDDQEEEAARDAVDRQSAAEIEEGLQRQRQRIIDSLMADPLSHVEVVEIDLQNSVRRAVSRSATLGVDVAIRQFDNVGLSFDWALSHTQARESADEFAGLLVRDINETSRRRVQTAIAEWIDTGNPLSSLVNDIAPVFGRDRAELIASTEVTRAYARGTEIAYRQSGVVDGLQWFTVNDERTCPICAPLGGLTFGDDGAEPASSEQQERNAVSTGLGQSFVHPGGTGDAGRFAGRTFGLPPAHPRCRCRILAILGDNAVAAQPSQPARTGAAPANPLSSTSGVDEVESWISQRYPDTTFDLSGGIDANIARRAVVQYDKLAEQWPEVAKRLRYFGTYADESKRISPERYRSFSEFPGLENAHAWIDDQIFGINPLWFRNPIALEHSMQEGLLTGWFDADGSIESLITHEFGHMIGNYLDGLKSQRPFRMPDGSDVEHEFPETGTISAMFSALFRKHDATSQLSTYATTNLHEATAEAFANVVFKKGVDKNGESIELAERFKQFLNEFLASESSLSNDDAPVRKWDDLTESDQEIWLQERLKARKRFGID